MIREALQSIRVNTRWNPRDAFVFFCIFLLMSYFILSGRLMIYGGLVVAAWGVWLAYRWTIFVAGLAVLQSINFFQFIHQDVIIKMQLAPGLRINTLDALVLLLLPLAILRLIERKDKPLFLTPVALILGMTVLSLGLGLLLGTTNLDHGMGLLRTLFYYTAYIIIVSAIDSPRRLKQWIGFLITIFIVSIFIQMSEAVIGQHLSFGLFKSSYYTAGKTISAGSYRVMYLWNRAYLLSALVFFLCLGVLFQGGHSRWYWVIAAFGAISIILAFVRQWYVYYSIGILTLFIIESKGRLRNIFLISFIILSVFLLLGALSPLLEKAFGPDFLQAFFGRAGTLMNYKTELNFIVRVEVMRSQWNVFLQSPLIGLGLSPVFSDIASSDVGITNTLAQFGFLGLGPVVVLFAWWLVCALRLRRKITSSLAQGYVSGLVALGAVVVVSFLFSQNLATGKTGIWMICNALALLDRFDAFAPQS